jgi:hypothetical protein
MDDVSLFENDLFLNDINNFKYYTPFFIAPLRFMKHLTGLDYLNTINILHAFLHLIYGLMWFLLFYFITSRDFISSLFLSVLVRGIFWLPGMEIWGISELWTFMPRTVYTTLLPLPFLLLFLNNKYRVFIASFLVGLIFNFHPISGLGGILIFFITLLYFNKNLLEKSKLKISILLIGGLVFLGMLPFIINYFGKTSLVSGYDLILYQNAFDARIPSYFKNASSFISKWLYIKTLFIIFPIILLYVLPFFIKIDFKFRNFVLLLLVALFIVPIISIPIENYINQLYNLNIRMSFQLVRIQKLIVIPGFLALLYLFHYFIKTNRVSKCLVVSFMVIYFLCIPISHYSIFRNIPFLSDDITTSILPNSINLSENKKKNIDLMGEFIRDSLPKEVVFYNTTILRTVAKRAVILDHKGASILIEGNPEKLIEWDLNRNKLNQLQNSKERFIFLKELGVSHIVSKNQKNTLSLIKVIGEYNLYSLQ